MAAQKPKPAPRAAAKPAAKKPAPKKSYYNSTNKFPTSKELRGQVEKKFPAVKTALKKVENNPKGKTAVKYAQGILDANLMYQEAMSKPVKRTAKPVQKTSEGRVVPKPSGGGKYAPVIPTGPFSALKFTRSQKPPAGKSASSGYYKKIGGKDVWYNNSGKAVPGAKPPARKPQSLQQKVKNAGKLH